MSTPPRSPFTALVQRFLPRMRYPYLFLILGGLFLVDLVIPDPIPLVDELLLAILTFIAATFTSRRDRGRTGEPTIAGSSIPSTGPSTSFTLIPCSR